MNTLPRKKVIVRALVKDNVKFISVDDFISFIREAQENGNMDDRDKQVLHELRVKLVQFKNGKAL